MAKTPTDIRSLARSHTETMVEVLRCIANQKDAAPAARATAAIALLDRGWGKPEAFATVKHINTRADELTDDELAAIARGRSDEPDTPSVDPTKLN